MKPLDNLIVQLRSIWPTLLLVSAASMILMGTVLAVHFWKGVPIGDLTRDPLEVMDGAIYIGFLSQVGIFFWAASATVCLFAASVIAGGAGIHKLKSFFLAAGVLSLYLGLDDVFELHEHLFPRIGVSEKIVYVSYVGITVLWLIQFCSIILTTEYLLLGGAALFFSASIAIDVVDYHFTGHHLFEDGTKIIGIMCWLAYFYRTAVLAVRCNAAQQGTAPDGNSAPHH